MDDELETIETGTFRQACEREILSLIIRPLRKRYQKGITIQWPCENLFDKRIDFTRAYIFIENVRTHLKLRKERVRRMYDADIILRYENDNLNICCFHRTHIPNATVRQTMKSRVFFDIKEIPMANPHGHEEAIELLSGVINRKLSEINP